MTATGYEPLNTPKPVAENVWIIDGPAVVSYGFPFPTRATVVRLDNGDLWVHSPAQLTSALREEIDALGPVRHLVAPNWLHFVFMPVWQKAYPDAVAWHAPGVVERAAKNGLTLQFDHALRADRPEDPWSAQMEQLIVRGSKIHQEAVFFHKATRTLILTDLIEALETKHLPTHCRPYVWLNGIDDSDGKMPPLLRWTFRDKTALAEDIETMISWDPKRVIISHGRWYEANGVAELERAFRKLIQARRWEIAYRDHQESQRPK